MNETLRVPNENDAKEVARLLSEGLPEPVGPDTVGRDWAFPGVQVEMNVRLGPGLCESVGMRISAKFGIHAKSAQ